MSVQDNIELEKVRLWRGGYTLTVNMVKKDEGEYLISMIGIEKRRPTIFSESIVRQTIPVNKGETVNKSDIKILGIL